MQLLNFLKKLYFYLPCFQLIDDMLLGELKKPLVYSQNGVTFAAPKTTKGLFFGDVHRHLKDCFWQKKKTEKNKAKHCVIKKSILHLQPEKHQGVQGKSSCKKTVFEVKKMF